MENRGQASEHQQMRGTRADSRTLLPKLGGEKAAEQVTALRMDFVVKPENAGRMQADIEKYMRALEQQEGGFLDGMVLISEQEARLGTLITFWRKAETALTRSWRIRGLHNVLKPYVDQCLRIQVHNAHFFSRGRQSNPEDRNRAFATENNLVECVEVLCSN